MLQEKSAWERPSFVHCNKNAIPKLGSDEIVSAKVNELQLTAATYRKSYLLIRKLVGATENEPVTRTISK